MISPTRPVDLPDFDEPPVVETVLSAQFERLADVRTAHLGLLWGRFRDDFPRTEERPPLDPISEQFPETPRRVRLGLELQTLENPPVPRLWFITNQGNEMIQIQPDRFIKNWRKEGHGETYPRYEKIKASFERDFAVFRNFLADQRLGTPRINQCEVTYVNHIVAGEGWQSFSDAQHIFTFLAFSAESIPGRPEDARIYTRHVISGPDSKPIGRLHVEVQPAYRASDSQPMYVLHLTARGQIGEAIDFFDVGRSWIVRSFAALTTPRMHEIWRRKS